MAYWDPTQPGGEESEPIEEETRGCLTLLGFFLAAAFSISLLLIALGVIIHWITHFADYQTKLIWLTVSVLSGTILAGWWTRKRRRSDKHRPPSPRIK